MIFSVYSLPLLLSTLILTILAVQAWRNRCQSPITRSFVSTMLLATFWSLNFALEISAIDIRQKIFFSNMGFVAVAFLPVFFFSMAMHYTGQHLRLQSIILLLLVIPALTVLVVFTSSHHTLFRYDYVIDYSSGFPNLISYFGNWYWIHAIYSYLLLTVSFGVLFRYLIKASPIYRKQTLVLIVAMVIPLVIDLLDNLGLSPTTDFNYAPASFIISGLLIQFGVIRYQFLSVLPAARELIFDKMQDAYIVIDLQQHVIDANHAALRLIGLTAAKVIGFPAGEVLSNFTDLARRFFESDYFQGEIAAGDGSGRYFELQVFPLSAGKVALVRDITQRHRYEDELRYLSTHDTLTGLYNRAFFDAELSRLANSRYLPVSILMADLDDAKQTNDMYGHNMGDELLRAAARIMKSCFRGEDVIARIGGDEFAVIMPKTDRRAAESAAERLRQALRDQPAGCALQVSMSIGISTATQINTLGTTLQTADERMYEEKRRRKVSRACSAYYLN